MFYSLIYIQVLKMTWDPFLNSKKACGLLLDELWNSIWTLIILGEHKTYFKIYFPDHHIYTIFYVYLFYPLNLNLIPQWRTLIADFAIIISIMVFCALDHLMSLETPKLHVPTEIKVSSLRVLCVSSLIYP